MSDTVIIAGIGALQVIMLAYIASLTRRTEKNTNSLVTKLVATTAASSHAEGKIEGASEEKAKSGNP